jgi:membrane-associated protease RseP (regulator of RpoE activity)
MHPFFVVGASGLITNALNLLPIFRLDGGRACFAAVGPRQGAVISVFTLLLLISMVMSGASSTFIVWTFLVALLQRRQEIPPRDDVTEVDGKRLALWLLSFLLSVSIVAPFPGFRILNM